MDFYYQPQIIFTAWQTVRRREALLLAKKGLIPRSQKFESILRRRMQKYRREYSK